MPAVQSDRENLAFDHARNESERVSSIHRLLHDAVDAGSERGVVTAFAEALLAWDGVEVRGYVEDVDGNLSLAVRAPGAERGSVSVARERLAVAECGHTPVPVSPGDLQHLGLPPTVHALAVEIGSGSVEPWLLLFCRGFGAPDRARLALALDPLRDALGQVSTIAETRLAWSILHPLFAAAATGPEHALKVSLAAMARAFDSQRATLAVATPDDVVILQAAVGESASRIVSAGRRLTATAPLPERHRITLTLGRWGDRRFARREQHLADRAAALVAAWLSSNFHAVIAGRRHAAEVRGR